MISTFTSSSTQASGWTTEKKNSTMALPPAPIVPLCSAAALAASRKSGSTASSANPKDSFPVKLYELLQREDESVVGWQSHGRAFCIRDTERFVQEIMPK